MLNLIEEFFETYHLNENNSAYRIIESLCTYLLQGRYNPCTNIQYIRLIFEFYKSQ